MQHTHTHIHLPSHYFMTRRIRGATYVEDLLQMFREKRVPNDARPLPTYWLCGKFRALRMGATVTTV